MTDWVKIGQGIEGHYLEMPREMVHRWESARLHISANCPLVLAECNVHPASPDLCPIIVGGRR